MELQAVAELINSQTGITKPAQSKGGAFQGQQRAMLIWGMFLMLGAVAIAASLKILGKENIQLAGDFTPFLSVIMLFIAFIGMGLMCYPFLQTTFPQSGSRQRRSPKAEPAVKLNPEFLTDEPSSVTEQTTRFLEPSEAKIQRDTAPQGE
jgi:hypothetical protein